MVKELFSNSQKFLRYLAKSVFEVPPGSLKPFIWIREALHVTLLGSSVRLLGSICNASQIQMKRFRDPGDAAKNRLCKISQELLGVGK